MQYRKLGELKELESNPRIVKNREFKDLCESIKKNPKFFEARPLILSDRTGELVIIAGNMKFKAAKENKLKEVPTELISGLTEELEREIIIRDNTHAGNWDFDALANTWSDLPLVEWGIDLPEDWLKSLDNSKLPEAGSGEEKANETTCPKCGFVYAI
jgi:ParB-like chromosome segregation protein Spo0J